jgi:two-component system nitrogen regulation response regulator GlnG
MSSTNNLLELIDQYLEKFFQDHGGNCPDAGLYNRIVNEVEKHLIKKTLTLSKMNQSKTAKILGINRNTLRKKLDIYKIDVQ